MDLEERATDALSRLDDPLNELVYRLRNFCMIHGAVLERKDVEEATVYVKSILRIA